MAIGHRWISCSEISSPIVVKVQLRMSCHYNTILLKEILYSTDLSLYRLQIATMRITAARAWDNCWGWIPMQWHYCSARIWILRCCCGSPSRNWSFYLPWSQQVNTYVFLSSCQIIKHTGRVKLLQVQWVLTFRNQVYGIVGWPL